MKMASRYLFTTLILSLLFVINAKSQDMKYDYVVLSSERSLCWAEKIFTEDNSYTYSTTLGVAATSGRKSTFFFKISTLGDEEIINILRLHKSNIEKNHVTSGNIILDNGNTISSEKFVIMDTTDDELKEIGLGVGVIAIGINISDIQKLRNYNISKLIVNGQTIDFNKIKVKSAYIINGCCKELEKKGFSFGSSSSDTGSSGGSASMPTHPNTKKSKSAVELIYYPLGILDLDGKGLNNYSKALSELRSKTNWKFSESPNTEYFATYVHDGYDITWEGLPIFTVQMSFGKFFNWHYAINLDRSKYSKTQAEIYAKLFIKELAEEGFSVETGSLEGKPKYPIDKDLKKGTYKVKVTLIDSGSDSFTISIYSYPNY